MKHPFGSWASKNGGAEDKRRANRDFRHAVKAALKQDPVRDVFPCQREVFNVWFSARDCDGWFIFDPKENPKAMRK